MTQQIPILLINLDRDKERLASMQEQLAALSLQFRRLTAIVGDQLSDAERAALRPNGRQRREPYAAGEIGCYASHLAALRQIADGPDRFVCVLEDDTKLSSRFAAIVAAPPQIPESLGLIKLEGSGHTIPRLGLRIAGWQGETVTAYALPSWRTGAYLVSRGAAARLIERLGAMHGPIDQVLFEPWRTGVVVGEMRPFPLTQNAGSRIDPAGLRQRSTLGRWLLYGLRFLRGHAWFATHVSALLTLRAQSRRMAANAPTSRAPDRLEITQQEHRV